MHKKIYPNDPCPCGSGKKYKNCCASNPMVKLYFSAIGFNLSLTKEEAMHLLNAIDSANDYSKESKIIYFPGIMSNLFLKIGICDIIDNMCLPSKPYSKLVKKGIENGKIIKGIKRKTPIMYKRKENNRGVTFTTNESIHEIDSFELEKMGKAMLACVNNDDCGMKCNREKSQVGFVKDCLNRDISYLRFLINEILENYNNQQEFKLYDAMQRDGSLIWSRVNDFIINDELDIQFRWNLYNKEYDYSNMVLAPYDPRIMPPESNTDIYTEYVNGKLTLFQVVLFHEYIVRYLLNRFEEYRFLPENILRNENCLTTIYHKGFDILFAIAINLELQLGVHLVFQNAFSDSRISVEAGDDWFIKIFPCFNSEKYYLLPLGTKILMNSYMKTIDSIMENYNPYIEFNAVYKNNRKYDEEIKSIAEIVYMNLPQRNGFFLDYKNSLRAMCVGLLCGDDQDRKDLFMRSLQLCTQMDYLKMVEGISRAEDIFNTTKNAHWSKEDYIKCYHEAVFYLFDEKNGVNFGSYPVDLIYVDDDAYDALKSDNGFYRKNPSFRERFYYDYRHMRLEVFEMLGGTSFTWKTENGTVKGIYPLIPFYADHNLRITIKHPTEKATNYTRRNYLYNNNNIESIEERQEYLGFVKEIDEIPVACFKEYMTASVFYNWLKQKESIRIIQQQNEQLTQTNNSLNRHIALNQELLRSLSHSSANYLNSGKLAKTGTKLYTAVRDNPTLEELHLDGLLLLLQSDSETFLRRRLDSLVIRCSANGAELKENIREGVSRDKGVAITSPLDYAIKTILSRIVTRDDDIRSKAIRDKLDKTDDEWTELRNDFIINVLAKGESILQWCNTNICVINYTASNSWKKIKILEQRPLYDLIVEIVTEQLLNAFSHGDLNKGINITFNESDIIRRKGRSIPTWYNIQTINVPGKIYKGGKHTGIETLNTTLLLLNENIRGVEVIENTNSYKMVAWLEEDLLRPL